MLNVPPRSSSAMIREIREAGQHEEDVDFNVAAGKRRRAEVAKKDRGDGDSPEPVEFGAIPQSAFPHALRSVSQAFDITHGGAQTQRFKSLISIFVLEMACRGQQAPPDYCFGFETQDTLPPAPAQ